MMEVADLTLQLCSSVYKMAENAKTNKERCQRVAQRVRALQELVLTIKHKGPGQHSATVENSLRELCTTLESARTLMTKFSQTKGVKTWLKAKSHEEEFSKMNEKLTDNLQVLSGALQIDHGNILQKVYESVAARRQDEEFSREQETPTSPGAPMPLYSTMPPMQVSNPTSPTAPMLPPSTMPPMQVSNPTSPTAPMLPPSTMPPMQVSTPTSPTAPMLPPGTMSPMPPMQMSSPTAPMPVPCFMPPMSISSPTAPVPVRGTMPPMQISAPRASMPLLGTLAPMSVSQPVYTMMPPTVISAVAPQSIYRTMAPVRAPIGQVTLATPNTVVAKGYVVSNSYFR